MAISRISTNSVKDAAITLPKIATQVTATILGNNTGGAASPLALTASQTRTLLGLGTADNVVFSQLTAALIGNASTATTLATARNINGVSFNGSADITVTAAAGTLTGTTLNSSVVTSSLTSVGTLTSLTVVGTTTLATSLTGVLLGTAGVVSKITTGSNGDVLTVVAGVPAFAAPATAGLTQAQVQALILAYARQF